jgi:ATP-dependent protease HslVU (ClpYQ) peptidase subunit
MKKSGKILLLRTLLANSSPVCYNLFEMFPKKHWKGCGAIVPACRDFLEDFRKDWFYYSLHHVP